MRPVESPVPFAGAVEDLQVCACDYGCGRRDQLALTRASGTAGLAALTAAAWSAWALAALDCQW